MVKPVPRIVYHTIRRFIMLLSIIALVFGSVAAIAYLSNIIGPWIVFPLLGIFYGIVFSYNMAKFDVERENREQERVEQALKKDWTK